MAVTTNPITASRPNSCQALNSSSLNVPERHTICSNSSRKSGGEIQRLSICGRRSHIRPTSARAQGCPAPRGSTIGLQIELRQTSHSMKGRVFQIDVGHQNSFHSSPIA